MGPTDLIRQNCPIATENNDGLMSKEQAAQLAALSGNGTGTITVTGNEAVEAGQIVEVDIAYLIANPMAPLRFRVWRTAGGSPSAAGSALTACVGAGSSFTIVVGQVISLVTFWSDGTSTINPGDPVGFSGSVNGGVVSGGVPYLGTYVGPTAIGHVLGAPVLVWRGIA